MAAPVRTCTGGHSKSGGRVGPPAADALALLAVPASLQASLLARLDRLGPARKKVAQIGAVIGREFSYGLLQAVANMTDDALRERLVAEASEHVLSFDWADVARQTAALYAQLGRAAV